MTAQPVEHDDPLDPMRILEDLPEEERPFFAAQYREHAEAARDPAGWLGLHRFLRWMRFHADEAARDALLLWKMENVRYLTSLRSEVIAGKASILNGVLRLPGQAPVLLASGGEGGASLDDS